MAEINMGLKGNLEDAVDVMLKFKCHLCNKYLTVPPIHLSKDGTKYRCGRCKNIKCEVDNRCVLFERIAELFTVPCIYTDCKELLLWKDVQMHEKCCAHRTMACPVYYGICDMEFKIENLVDHMKCYHQPKNFHKGAMIHDIKKNHRSVNVLEAEGIPFLIFISFQKVFVVSMKPNTFFTYNLKLKSPGGSLLYENQIVNEYDEVIVCIECSLEKCTKLHHPYSQHHDKENKSLHCTMIAKERIAAVFGDFSEIKFIIEIIFTKENSKEIEPVNDSAFTSTLDELMANDVALRTNFECPVCMQYMVGRIFMCQTGHSICSECKLDIDSCPTCRSEIGSSRNFSLENLSENLNIACFNRKKACSFTGKLKDICIHEERCLEKE